MHVTLRRINYRHVLPDLVLLSLSLYLSVFIRVGEESFGPFVPIITKLLPLFLAIRIATLIAFGVYDIIWRFVSFSDALKIGKTLLLSSAFVVAATYLVDLGRLPRSTFFIDTFLSLLLLSGIRVMRRMLYENNSRKALAENGRFTLIYGAGANGRTLANRLMTDRQLELQLVGFIDDDPQKIGRIVAGIKVLGTKAELEDLIKTYRIQELIIASNLISGATLREVIQVARTNGVSTRRFAEVVQKNNERKSISLLREIELSDLLSRPKREIDLQSLDKLIQGKRVLVTGAGGSIGSELCRQILALHPARLLLLDHSEFNLYQIDQELRASPQDTSLIAPILADIKDRATLKSLMAEYTPQIVFHAAAYKHVHLVENNPFASIMNNVLGTKNLIDLALEADVEAFILISTDKAVNPAGVMGATKRVCELMIARAGQITGKRFCAVRFGNVLGSSGSLIPLLQKQIQNREPVTITHEGMTRYFMLIPEAVSLVLKAATIANPGDIAILRMGDPVKIVDIARSLIALMGKTENEVPIVFTGLRPGEKMFEELYFSGKEVNTEHPDILVLPAGDSAFSAKDGDSAGPQELEARVLKMIDFAKDGKREAVFELAGLVKSTCFPSPKLAAGEKKASSFDSILQPDSPQ